MQVLTIPLTFRFNGSFERAGFVYILLRLTHGPLNVKCCYVKWHPSVKNWIPQADTKDGWTIWFLTTLFRSFTLKCNRCLMRSVTVLKSDRFRQMVLYCCYFLACLTVFKSEWDHVQPPGQGCSATLWWKTTQFKSKCWRNEPFAFLRQNLRFVFLHILGSCSLNPSHRTIIKIILEEFVCEDFSTSVGP